MDGFQINMRSEVWFITLAPLIGITLVLVLGARLAPWTVPRIVGLVLTIVGIVPLTIARFNLGDSFSIAPEARKLVTHGIYSRIRHPVYVFSPIIIAGIALYLGIAWLLIALVVVIPLQIARARREGQVLEARFGEEYRAYRRKTWL